MCFSIIATVLVEPIWKRYMVKWNITCPLRQRESLNISILFIEVLRWQIVVCNNPHDFIIAKHMWSVKISYLLVSFNKQFSLGKSRALQPACLYTFNQRKLPDSVGLLKMAVTSWTQWMVWIENLQWATRGIAEILMLASRNNK